MDQTSTHAALAQALRDRLAVIADREAYDNDPAAHLDRLKAVSQTIEQLQGQLPQPINPELAHYLQRCSYDKALRFLERELGTPS